MRKNRKKEVDMTAKKRKSQPMGPVWRQLDQGGFATKDRNVGCGPGEGKERISERTIKKGEQHGKVVSQPRR